MAIKVTEDKNKKGTGYPCLKISAEGEVILFIKPYVGVCVKGTNENANKVGDYSIAWAEDSCFTLYNGKITLENE